MKKILPELMSKKRMYRSSWAVIRTGKVGWLTTLFIDPIVPESTKNDKNNNNHLLISFIQDSLFSSSEMLAMRVICFLWNTYERILLNYSD